MPFSQSACHITPDFKQWPDQAQTRLCKAGQEREVGLQELEGAVLLPQLRKGTLGRSLLGVLGVAVARKQALRDVQAPLLGLPPGPRLARR